MQMKTYAPKKRTDIIKAIQFDGTSIPTYISEVGIKVPYLVYDPSIELHYIEIASCSRETVFKGDWLILLNEAWVTVLSDTEFQARYELCQTQP